MSTITYTGHLTTVTCHCGLWFAIPADMYTHRRRSGEKFYCPLGHTCLYRETDTDRERKRAEQAEATATRLRARLDQAEADADHQRSRVKGYQGALAKTKKRAAAGVCPVPGCKRSFANVARHVAKQHPDFCDHDEAVA